MTIERRRPLPAGRYWIDVFDQHAKAWEAWQMAFVGQGKATVEVTEDFPATSSAPHRQFIIFRTHRELVWPDDEMKIGVNVAPPNINSSADTVQRPDPEPSIELPTVGDITGGLANAATTVAWVLAGTVVFVGIVAAVKVARGPRR